MSVNVDQRPFNHALIFLLMNAVPLTNRRRQQLLHKARKLRLRQLEMLRLYLRRRQKASLIYPQLLHKAQHREADAQRQIIPEDLGMQHLPHLAQIPFDELGNITLLSLGKKIPKNGRIHVLCLHVPDVRIFAGPQGQHILLGENMLLRQPEAGRKNMIHPGITGRKLTEAGHRLARCRMPMQSVPTVRQDPANLFDALMGIFRHRFRRSLHDDTAGIHAPAGKHIFRKPQEVADQRRLPLLTQRLVLFVPAVLLGKQIEKDQIVGLGIQGQAQLAGLFVDFLHRHAAPEHFLQEIPPLILLVFPVFQEKALLILMLLLLRIQLLPDVDQRLLHDPPGNGLRQELVHTLLYGPAGKFKVIVSAHDDLLHARKLRPRDMA